jgi:hypothetical protein
MSHVRRMLFACLVAVAVAGVMLPGAAQAMYTITNTGTVNFDNEAGTPQTAVSGSTTFTAESDPILVVVKTRDVGSGPSGTTVTFQIKVTYPQIADTALLCGDDSDADSVVMTDAIPAGFTYDGETMRLSVNNGSTWTNLTDADDSPTDEANYSGGTITVGLGTLTEGMGDAACGMAGAARIIEFQATKD